MWDKNGARIDKADGREVHRCGQSDRIDWETGNFLQTDTATVQIPLTGEHPGIGGPHVAGNTAQVILQAAAVNPVVTIDIEKPLGFPLPFTISPAIIHAWTPAIDYGLDIQFNRKTGALTYSAVVGSFPAFEAYVSVNGKAPVTLFTAMPAEDTTATSLYDLGLGGGNRKFSATIPKSELSKALPKKNAKTKKPTSDQTKSKVVHDNLNQIQGSQPKVSPPPTPPPVPKITPTPPAPKPPPPPPPKQTTYPSMVPK